MPPAVVQRVSAQDLDIVTERLERADFDLIIATNVLVYYHFFDQALAYDNLASMLRNGGFLLTNTVLPEILSVPSELVDSDSVVYNRAGEGDHMLWYQHIAGAVK